MTKPPANVLNLPLEERAEMALKAGVENVILESAREGRPIYVWRDGALGACCPGSRYVFC